MLKGRHVPPAVSEWVLDALGELSDGLIVVDASSHIVYRNEAVRRLLGLDELPADTTRWPATIGMYDPDRATPLPPPRMALARGLQGEETRDMAVFIRNSAVPQGVHLLVSGATLRDERGAIRGAAVLFRDVTLLRQHEATLREAERQKKAILDNLPAMAWLKDERGRFLVVNQRFAELVGKPGPEDIVGLTAAEVFPPGIAEEYQARDRELLSSGVPFRHVEEFVGADGRRAWVETIQSRIVDDAGRVIGLTGVAHDITERKQALQELRAARDELELRVQQRTAELAQAQENLVRQERLAVLGQLAGGVAHQIRNPLAAILNSTYVLRRHLPVERHPDVNGALEIIHDEVRHANNIITGLLDFARVRAPDPEPTSLVELIRRVLDSEWIPPAVRVTRELPDEPLVLSVDPDQLQASISNVVQNAVDAMANGGELAISLTRADGEIVIVVSDTGPGISAEVRPHLFEPLHSTKPMGVGLGLVTARRFIEAHGGRITCADVPRGASFEIRLPAG